MIKADNLVKKYGNFELDISMEVQEGYITGLVGKNGAGKSTAIKLILGLIRPDSGNITVLGKCRASLPERISRSWVLRFPRRVFRLT